MIFIEKKTDIAAPAMVTDIQPDRIITRLIAQAAMDGAQVGEVLWESATRSHTNTIPQRIELCGR